MTDFPAIKALCIRALAGGEGDDFIKVTLTEAEAAWNEYVEVKQLRADYDTTLRLVDELDEEALRQRTEVASSAATLADDRLAATQETLRRIMAIPTPAGNTYADAVWDAIRDEDERECTWCGGEGLCTDGADPLGNCPDEAHRCHACNGSGKRSDQTLF